MGQDEERRVIGLALKADKAQKHVSQALVDRAAAAGLELRLVDSARPLEEQGPFNVLLQKIRDGGEWAVSGAGHSQKPLPLSVAVACPAEWEAQLESYLARHPEVRVCDHPAATRPLRNRAEMLAGLEGQGWRFEVGGRALPLLMT